MYSQQQYQQHQQQHQQYNNSNQFPNGTPATSAPQSTWNGHAWVPIPQYPSNVATATATVGYGSTSSSNAWYNQANSQPPQPFHSNVSYSQTAPSPQAAVEQPTNAHLIHLYTDYYYQYTRLHDEYTTRNRGLITPTPVQASEAEWAKYHADLASRAAHYFHQHPHAVTATSDMVLPPAPPPSSSASNVSAVTPSASSVTLRPSQYEQEAISLQHDSNPFAAAAWKGEPTRAVPNGVSAVSASTTARNPPATTDGMQRYVDRCLVHNGGSAATPEAATAIKAAVMKQLQFVIRDELVKGTLPSINWETRPILVVTPETAPTGPNQTTGHDYGPSGNATGPQGQESYYGPSVGSRTGPTVQSGGSGGSANRWVKPNSAFQSKSKPSKRKSDSVVDMTDSYYGPSEPNPSPFEIGNEFISVPSYNKSLVKKGKKQTNPAGFTQTDTVLSQRANRFSGKGGVQDAAASTKKSSSSGEWDRYMGKKTIGGSHKKLDETDYETMTIRGTCQTLEKAYLRLTAPPRPELVRPQPVLEQHLDQLRRERALDAASRHDYLWFCSQLKAVRQDCTVQRIQNAFAVDVYELHAKIALEEDDLNEYNQCQTQLKELYAQVSNTAENDTNEAVSDRSNRQRALRHSNEFLAYRLVYFVFLTMESQKYDGVSSDMFKVMLSLSHQQRQDPLIQHALKVREACCSGILDYHMFFRLRRECLRSGDDTSAWNALQQSHLIYLLDRIVPSMRQKALHIICKGYRPSTVPVNFVLQELGFSNATSIDVDAGRVWLQGCGGVLSDDEMELQTKETVLVESADTDKQSLI